MSKTGKAVTLAAAALLGWETWTLLNKEPEDTISETLWRQMHRPLVPFAIGALAAHMVWQSQDVYDAILRKAKKAVCDGPDQ